MLEVVPITQPGSSSSLSSPSSGSFSSSSWSSPLSPSSELVSSLRLSQTEFNLSSNVVRGIVVVKPPFSAFLISSCSCLIAVSASLTRFLATAVSLYTFLLIHWSFSLLLEKCVSCRFPATSFFSDRNQCNAPRVRTISASQLLLLSFAWWRRRVKQLVVLPYLPAGSCERIFFAASTVIFCVDFVAVRDVGCCKIWTTWGQAASFTSKLVCLIDLNKATSAFWLSLQRKWQC